MLAPTCIYKLSTEILWFWPSPKKRPYYSNLLIYTFAYICTIVHLCTVLHGTRLKLINIKLTSYGNGNYNCKTRI